MAKNTNKRAERIAKNNRNMEKATKLLFAGFVAELYFLLMNNFYAKGAVGQVLAGMTFLKVMVFLGVAAVGAGIAMLFLHKKNGEKFSDTKWWLLGIGVLLTLSSELMLKIYPQGTAIMCAAVPAAILLGIIFLLYPREFAAEALGLAAAITAMVLLNKTADSAWAGAAKALALAAAAFIAVMIAFIAKAKSADGHLCKECKVFGVDTKYSLIFAVLGVCLAAVLLSVFAAGTVYYVLWAISALALVLAVYYTVKVM